MASDDHENNNGNYSLRSGRGFRVKGFSVSPLGTYLIRIMENKMKLDFMRSLKLKVGARVGA